MHVGPDANHGHYIAHIQELETGNWFKFSDEHVESIDRKCVSDKGNKKPKGRCQLRKKVPKLQKFDPPPTPSSYGKHLTGISTRKRKI